MKHEKPIVRERYLRIHKNQQRIYEFEIPKNLNKKPSPTCFLLMGWRAEREMCKVMYMYF